MIIRNQYTVVAAALLLAGTAWAGVPMVLNYHGRLFDQGGQPVNGNLAVQVALFGSEIGGSQVYTQSIGNVLVRDGLYNFTWGDAYLETVLTNTPECWMEITIGGSVLSPRQRFDSVPYAVRAASASQLTVPLASVPEGGIAIWSGSLATIPAGWVLCDGSNGTPDLRERFVLGAPAATDPGATGGANSFTLSESQLPAHTHSASSSTAGSHTHSGSTSSAGNHTHSASTSTDGNHNHTFRVGNCYGYVSASTDYAGGHGNSGSYTEFDTHSAGAHTHSVSINSAGNHSHTVTINSGGSHVHTITLQSAGSSAAIDNRPAFYALAYVMKL